jgi:hypothetical protein
MFPVRYGLNICNLNEQRLRDLTNSLIINIRNFISRYALVRIPADKFIDRKKALIMKLKP